MTVVGGGAETPDADFFADQIRGRLDRRMNDDHLAEPIKSANHDQICAGNPRLNRLRPAYEAELHIAAQQR